MANILIQKLVNNCENCLSSETLAKEFIPEVTKLLNELTDKNKKSAFVIKLAYSVCAVMNNGHTLYHVYVDFFKILIPHVCDEHWDKFIPRFKFFLAYLASKNRFKEAFEIIPLFDIKTTDDEQIIQIYFETNRNTIPLILLSVQMQYSQQYICLCLKNMIKILTISLKQKCLLFQNFLKQIFDVPNNFKMLLRDNMKGKEIRQFFAELFNLFKYIKIENDDSNLNKFYLDMTKHAHTILSMESVHNKDLDYKSSSSSSSMSITSVFLKAMITIDCVQNDKYRQYSITLLYHFLKLYEIDDHSKFNERFQEICTKLLSYLNCDEYIKNMEIYYYDTVVNVIEILSLNSKQLIHNCNTENIISCYKLIEKLFKIIPDIKNYSKIFCKQCTQLKRHQILNITKIIISLCPKLIEFSNNYSTNNNDTEQQLKDINILKELWSTMIIIINYTISIDFQCDSAKNLLEYLLKKYFQNLDKNLNTTTTDEKCIGIKIAVSYALKTSKILIEKDSCNIDKQILYYLQYKFYMKLEKYDESIKFLSLYIVKKLKNILNNDNDNNKNHMKIIKKYFEYDVMNLCKIYSKNLYNENDLNSSNKTICDIINENCKNLNENEFNSYYEKILLKLQFELCLKYNIVNENLKEFITDKVLEQVKNCNGVNDLIEYSMIINKINDFQRIEMNLEIIENSIRKLNMEINKNNINFNKENYIALGNLYITLLRYKLNKMKKQFNEKITTEKILVNVNLNEFEKISIQKENDILDVSNKFIQNYTEFYEKYLKYKTELIIDVDKLKEQENKFKDDITKSNNNDDDDNNNNNKDGDDNGDNIDWNEIIDNIAFIGRHLSLRGYIKYAYKGWLLIYKISIMIKDNLNKIRSLSYFAKHYTIIKSDLINNEKINLNHILNNENDNYIQYLNDINKLTPRQQNYIMICLLNFSIYYELEKQHKQAKILKDTIKYLLNTIDNRKNKFELVKATIYSVEFYYLTKFINNYHSNNNDDGGGGGDDSNVNNAYHNNENIQITPYKLIQNLLDEIRNIKFITSEDSVNIPEFLFNFIMDLVWYLNNRLLSSTSRVFLFMLLRYSIEIGLTYRTCQILNVLCHTDLQMEMVTNCQLKLVIIDRLLMRDCQSPIDIVTTKSDPLSAKNEFNFLTPYDALAEPARKVITNRPVSPINMKCTISRSDLSKNYLIDHSNNCKCEFCINDSFLMIIFDMGCLYARIMYITEEYTNSKDFFSNAYKWLSKFNQNKSNQNIIDVHFLDTIMWMYIYYLNTLCRLDDFIKVQHVYDLAMDFFKIHSNYIDIAYYQNLIEQITSVNCKLNKRLEDKVQETNSINKKLLPSKENNPCKKALIFTPSNSITNKIKNQKIQQTKEKKVKKLPTVEIISDNDDNDDENNNRGNENVESVLNTKSDLKKSTKQTKETIVQKKKENIKNLEKKSEPVKKIITRSKKLQNTDQEKSQSDNEVNVSCVMRPIRTTRRRVLK